MNDITERFFTAYWRPGLAAVYTEGVSADMMAAPEDDEGWFEWKLVKGTLTKEDYEAVEEEYQIQLPQSFIDWHKAFFFPDGDCMIAQLPASLPNEPLEHLRRQLNYGGDLISQGLYPFASDGNNVGPLVFDARHPVINNEFPIRIYDHEFVDDLNGLGQIIFSSFSKMLECLTDFLNRPETVDSGEAISSFFEIDPLGAGGPGKNYWLSYWGNTRWPNRRV